MAFGISTIEKLKKLIRRERGETGKPVRSGAVAVEKDGAQPGLYACEWCGELFESAVFPISCPQCCRSYTDSVEELDTGRVFGGRFVIREATGREAEAYYRLRQNGETKRIRTDVVRQED